MQSFFQSAAGGINDDNFTPLRPWRLDSKVKVSLLKIHLRLPGLAEVYLQQPTFSAEGL